MEALRVTPADLDLDRINSELRDATAEDVIRWAVDTFGAGLVLSSSFGATAAVMLHMVSRIRPTMPVVCIDTGYLFPETYRFAAEVEQRFGLPLKWYGAEMTQARQEALFGKLWEQGDDGVKRYLFINKVEPMQRALRDLGATSWLAGLRADQTEHRGALRRVGIQDGRVKIHPIIHWSAADLDGYMAEHDLPYHPLYAEGYKSIGDHHSTLPVTDDMDPRAGRMLGSKRECGLHLPLSEAANQSFKSSGL